MPGTFHSQNGEDGILEEALRRICPPLKVAVEFGGADDFWFSNTRKLAGEGWTLHMYDRRACEPFIAGLTITPQNVNSLPRCSLISIDTDGPDAGIWQAYEARPDLVIIEINSMLNPSVDFYDPAWGANYSHMKRLAAEKGYTLLCHTGNMLFTLREHEHLFPDADATFRPC